MNTEELEKKFGVTADELEKSAEAYESGEWPAGRTTRIGRPPFYDDDELESITFRLSKSRIRAIEAILAEKGKTRSEFLREAVDQALINNA